MGRWTTIIIILAIGYVVGARWPAMAQKVGIA